MIEVIEEIEESESESESEVAFDLMEALDDQTPLSEIKQQQLLARQAINEHWHTLMQQLRALPNHDIFPTNPIQASIDKFLNALKSWCSVNGLPLQTALKFYLSQQTIPTLLLDKTQHFDLVKLLTLQNNPTASYVEIYQAITPKLPIKTMSTSLKHELFKNERLATMWRDITLIFEAFATSHTPQTLSLHFLIQSFLSTLELWAEKHSSDEEVIDPGEALILYVNYCIHNVSDITLRRDIILSLLDDTQHDTLIKKFNGLSAPNEEETEDHQQSLGSWQLICKLELQRALFAKIQPAYIDNKGFETLWYQVINSYKNIVKNPQQFLSDLSNLASMLMKYHTDLFDINTDGVNGLINTLFWQAMPISFKRNNTKDKARFKRLIGMENALASLLKTMDVDSPELNILYDLLKSLRIHIVPERKMKLRDGHHSEKDNPHYSYYLKHQEDNYALGTLLADCFRDEEANENHKFDDFSTEEHFLKWIQGVVADLLQYIVNEAMVTFSKDRHAVILKLLNYAEELQRQQNIPPLTRALMFYYFAKRYDVGGGTLHESIEDNYLRLPITNDGYRIIEPIDNDESDDDFKREIQGRVNQAYAKSECNVYRESKLRFVQERQFFPVSKLNTQLSKTFGATFQLAKDLVTVQSETGFWKKVWNTVCCMFSKPTAEDDSEQQRNVRQLSRELSERSLTPPSITKSVGTIGFFAMDESEYKSDTDAEDEYTDTASSSDDDDEMLVLR